jgi:protein TonB
VAETDPEHFELEEALELPPPDETVVPAFDIPRSPTTALRRRSGLLVAALVSVAIHGVLVTVAAWAIGNGLVLPQFPTAGSRGEMAEGGLSDDPGVSALSETRFAPEQTAVISSPATAPPASDDGDESSESRFDEFAIRAEVPHEDLLPLIGLSDASSSLPAKLPPRHRAVATEQPESQSKPAASEDGMRSEGGAPSVATVGAASASATTTNSGIGADPFTPPHPTGRSAGLSGRRGGRGLDSRGLPIPDYPRKSRLRREEGTVVLDVGVNPEGHVESVLIVSSSGYPQLDAAAAFAIREAEFTPALLGGRAVKGTVRVPYRFRLE